jgi:hypothetical protein
MTTKPGPAAPTKDRPLSDFPTQRTVPANSVFAVGQAAREQPSRTRQAREPVDLPRLQAAGVRFVKVNGSQLIDQLRDPHGPRPATALNRKLSAHEVGAAFSRYGIMLIAEKIEDEASVVEILAYEIPFGQGHVFSAPRPIKSSLMEDTAPPRELIERLSNYH